MMSAGPAGANATTKRTGLAGQAGSASARAGDARPQAASAAKLQATQQSQTLLYQEQVARNNAQITEWQAQDALRQGQQQETQLRLQAGGLRSEQRVAYAASGVALDSDTVINTMVSTDYMTEVDAATIRNNAQRAAWGYRVQGNNYIDQATAARYGADAYQSQADSISPGKAVFSSLLTSAAQMAPGVYGMYKSGAFGGGGGGGKFLNAGGGKTLTAFDVKSRF